MCNYDSNGWDGISINCFLLKGGGTMHSVFNVSTNVIGDYFPLMIMFISKDLMRRAINGIWFVRYRFSNNNYNSSYLEKEITLLMFLSYPRGALHLRKY